MKKLIISMKPAATALNEVAKRLSAAQKNKGKAKPHFEISFTDIKQLKKFLNNFDLIISIQLLRPSSIYELSRLLKKDVNNLNKTINFFEELGALELEERVVKGRKVKRPTIPYEKIEFDLAS